MRGKEHISHLSDTAPTVANHVQSCFRGPSVSQFDKQLTWAVYKGDPRLCSQLCESEGSTSLPLLELSCPGHPSFPFFSVTLPKRVELQGLSSPLCCPSVTFPDMLSLIFLPACCPANRRHFISALHSILWKVRLPYPCQSHPSQLSIEMGSPLCTACPCLEITHQLGWQ